MKLVAHKLGKSDKLDQLRFLRSDGSETRCPMPRQGILPHDLVHYVVETALPLCHGFLSQVAAGADAGFVMQALHDPANHAVKREAVQAEAVVEALQAQLWAGAFDQEGFLDAARLAAAARGIPGPDLSDVDSKAMFDRAVSLLQQWNQVPFHRTMELDFHEPRP